MAELYSLEEKPERAIAVSAVLKSADREIALEHLDELVFLAETAGAEVIDKFYQELEKINSTTVIGKGKLEEIKSEIENENITLVIFDDDLSPAQVRNLENQLQIKVIDRSGLILDIFAKRARTIEAKTQVELAQLQYLMPRLTRMWQHLSKQFGGIGTKGPGETQIEVDRRTIRIRIQKLKDRLKDIEIQKEQQRKGRESMPQFALVGYTNAGKSTLMNAVTMADVYIENKLFATLDTTVRSFELPSGLKSIFSDTVGFIRKLPHHLVASFRRTLAEARNADVLIHVVDVTHKSFREQIAVVNETLDILKIKDKPEIIAFNKIDILENMDEMRRLQEEFPSSVFLSAKRNINIQKLLALMQEVYEKQNEEITLMLPYSRMNLVSQLYTMSEIISRRDEDEGIIMTIRVINEKRDNLRNMYKEFILNV